MSRLGNKLRVAQGNRIYHYCPACEHAHGITANTPDGWVFNNDPEKPTFSPSVRVTSTRPKKKHDGTEETVEITTCHYFLNNGVLEYCSDSPHALAGKSVPLPDWPENYGFGGS
jgi:hypothetical protein